MTFWESFERCAKAQQATQWPVVDSGTSAHVPHALHHHYDLESTHQFTPNLLLWSGSRHILIMTLKEDVAR
jgi:hypothetical protein